MEDSCIVDLYWARSEQAIDETSSKYGKYCFSIAYHILYNTEDADEAVNDTYMGAWNSMPPHRPSILSTFLGKITRRISINKWNERKADRRGGGEIPLALEELSDVAESMDNRVEQAITMQELSASINSFLSTLPALERDMFVCRYWFMAPVDEISVKFGFSPSKTKSALFRTRKKLKRHLGKEGLI